MQTTITSITALSELEIGSFHCGDYDLDVFFHNYALENEEENISRTFVLLTKKERQIVGYFTLSCGGLLEKELGSNKKYPKYQLPMVRLGRLAIAPQYQKKGFGRRILLHIFQTVLDVSKKVAILGIFVDAKEKSVSYYQQFNFTILPVMNIQKGLVPMFLSLKTLEKAQQKA